MKPANTEDVLSIFDKVRYSELSEREKQIYNQGKYPTRNLPDEDFGDGILKAHI